MKHLILSIVVLTGGVVLAQDSQPPPRTLDSTAALLAQALFKNCDANKDGRFDANEAAAAKAAALKKYDTNGNGVVDVGEIQTMVQDAKSQGLRPLPSNDSGRGNEMLKKYDANGDGKLDEAERTTMKAELRKNGLADSEQRRKEMMKKYDADGDGKLNEAERTKMKEEMLKNLQPYIEKSAAAKPE